MNLAAGGAVTNFGTIEDQSSTAVYANGPLNITNGDASHTYALIHGDLVGISAHVARSTITNFGTIVADGKNNQNHLGFGILLGGPNGTVINHGSIYAVTTGISDLFRRDDRVNSGTIDVSHSTISGAAGIELNSGSISNSMTSALIECRDNGVAIDIGRLPIFHAHEFRHDRRYHRIGRLCRAQRIGCQLRHRQELRHARRRHVRADVRSSSNDRLIDEGGGVFIGGVAGAGGVLELAAAGGVGTLTGLGISFTNFGAVDVDAGAIWSLNGSKQHRGAAQPSPTTAP